MARNYWTIQTQDSGDVWSNYSTIPRPNENFAVGTTGTLIQNQLSNGSLGFVLPKSLNGSLVR